MVRRNSVTVHFPVQQNEQLGMLGFLTYQVRTLGKKHDVFLAAKVIIGILYKFLEELKLNGQGNRPLKSDAHSPQKPDEIRMLPVDFFDADFITCIPTDLFHWSSLPIERYFPRFNYRPKPGFI